MVRISRALSLCKCLHASLCIPPSKGRNASKLAASNRGSPIRRCARGSGRRREDAGPERRRFGRGTDSRPISAGGSRAGRNTWHVAAERQDHSIGALRGLPTGAWMVTKKPDLLWALVGTGQVGNPAGALVHMTSLSLRGLPKQARQVAVARS